MRKYLKSIIAFIMIVLIGTLFSMIIAFFFSGLTFNRSITMNMLFYCGMIAALLGGCMNVATFINFKARVKKTPIYQEIAPPEIKEVRWDYALIAGGAVIFIISYMMAASI